TGKEVYQHVLKSTAWIVIDIQGGAATGTGSIVDMKNRLVLTNYHVVANHQGPVKGVFPVYNQRSLVPEKQLYKDKIKNNDFITATVISQDSRRDLALIQLARLPDGVQALSVARNSVSPGEEVHSVGNPGKSDGLWAHTSGTVKQVYEK